MSPRPRKASDDDVFGAAVRVMARMGPGQITLADIAREAGLTPGALVQRFGSKRGLLLTLAERFAGSIDQMFAGLRAATASPLVTLYAYADGMAQMGESPDVLANHLSWLQQDLTDPDFRRFTMRHARATRRELERLVREAIDAGLLRQAAPPSALARAIEVTVGGSLMTWAVYQEGKAPAWVRQHLDTILRPYVTAKGRATVAAAARTRRMPVRR
jgi:AcrR family transcriptional regulator